MGTCIQLIESLGGIHGTLICKTVPKPLLQGSWMRQGHCCLQAGPLFQTSTPQRRSVNRGSYMLYNLSLSTRYVTVFSCSDSHLRISLLCVYAVTWAERH